MSVCVEPQCGQIIFNACDVSGERGLPTLGGSPAQLVFAPDLLPCVHARYHGASAGASAPSPVVGCRVPLVSGYLMGERIRRMGTRAGVVCVLRSIAGRLLPAHLQPIQPAALAGLSGTTAGYHLAYRGVRYFRPRRG